MENHELAIIGGGPTGLFATFCAGIRSIESITLEALDVLGGQIIGFYLMKDVLDMAGVPRIKGAELQKQLVDQANMFGTTIVTGVRVTDIRKEQDGFVIEINGRDSYTTKAVLICTGIGSLAPTPIGVPGEMEYLDKGVFYTVTDTGPFTDRVVAIIGGGDSGFDWANQIVGVAKRIHIVEALPKVKAMERSVNDLMETGKGEIHVSTLVNEVIGDGAHVTGITAMDRISGVRSHMDVDAVIVAIGLKTKGNTFKTMRLQTVLNRIRVNHEYETSVPGVYAAGDTCLFGDSPKPALLATCAAEAYGAINSIKKYLTPTASVLDSHSTDVKL